MRSRRKAHSPKKRYITRWWGTAGWRISNAKTGKPWGHAYSEIPTALLDELNGQCRLDICLELDRRIKKTDWRFACENQDQRPRR